MNCFRKLNILYLLHLATLVYFIFIYIYIFETDHIFDAAE